MKKYKVVRKPLNMNWGEIPEVSMEFLPWTSYVDISATARLCYDEENLYICLTAKEEHIRAELTGTLDLPCLDSCLEFFFSPILGDERYINIEYNPNGCLYMGIGSVNNDNVRLLPENSNLLKPCIARTLEGWEITYQVPSSFVRLFFPEFVLEAGKTIYANFYKCGELTMEKHYLAWNKVMSEEPNFHRPCDFGVLELA